MENIESLSVSTHPIELAQFEIINGGLEWIGTLKFFQLSDDLPKSQNTLENSHFRLDKWFLSFHFRTFCLIQYFLSPILTKNNAIELETTQKIDDDDIDSWRTFVITAAYIDDHFSNVIMGYTFRCWESSILPFGICQMS